MESLFVTYRAFRVVIYNENSMKTVEEAQSDNQWHQEMQVEMDTLVKNQTWEKCKLPAGKKIGWV